MKIGISGPGRCGKDTAAEWLGRHTTMRYKAGTSLWAASMVFDHLQRADGPRYATKDDCWQDRHNHRMLWAEVIAQYNRDDPVAMYRDCLAEQDILTGVRWRHEFEAINAAGLVDLWVWVERPGVELDLTMQYTADNCDVVVLNTGTLGAFLGRWLRLARAWGVLREAGELVAG